MKLIEGEVDSSYRVVHMDLPLNVDRRLEALGMTGDSRILVMNKKKKGRWSSRCVAPGLPSERV